MGKTNKQQFPIVLGCVIDGDRVVLIKRNEPSIPALHDKWELPGGKVEFGEDPAKTAEREVFEETGVYARAAELLPFTHVAIRKTPDGLLNVIVLCFRCEVLQNSLTNHPPKKVGEVAWKHFNELDPAFVQTGTLQFIKHILDRGKSSGQIFPQIQVNHHYMFLQNVDPQKNKRRFYSITLETSLSASQPFIITTAWGRINRSLKSKLFEFQNRDEALDSLHKLVALRKQHGYVISETSPHFPDVPGLSDMKKESEVERQLRFGICR